MPHSFTEGDSVEIADREPTPADTKSQLFFSHYRGIRGIISKLYPDGTALVIADNASLPDDARARHTEGAEAMRRKWLDSLSEEGRNRLSAAEKKFALRYSLLVAQADLRESDTVPESAAAPRKTTQDLEAEESRHLSQKSRAQDHN